MVAKRKPTKRDPSPDFEGQNPVIGEAVPNVVNADTGAAIEIQNATLRDAIRMHRSMSFRVGARPHDAMLYKALEDK